MNYAAWSQLPVSNWDRYGAVDLVIQVATPLSVASGLQRIGRAGHQVGGISKGLFFPRTRRDLVDSAVIVECMFQAGWKT
ncbi:hypothetical protein ACLB1Q_04195 [Escherichia coli]